jgi:tRNA(Met) cytidine acetyltransferase
LKEIDLSLLLQQPERLAHVFGLLRFAHYQTSLRDLWALLEDESLRLFVLEQQEQVIAAALIGIEGQFSAELSQEIANGKRRVQGHLSAQSLAFHLAAPSLSQLKIARIQRIVVHPELQQRGFGRLLLVQLSQRLRASDVELLTTSFGASAGLVKFWQHADFSPVRLSQKIEQSSNAPSVLMVKSLQNECPSILLDLIKSFGQQLYWQQKQQCSLPLDLLKMWMAPPQQPLSQQQTQQLVTALSQQKLLTVIPLLEMWLNNHIYHSQSAVVDELIAVFWLNSVANERIKRLGSNMTIVCQTILQTLVDPD